MKGIDENMKNIFDTLYDDKLIHVISDTQQIEEISDKTYSDTVIAINLYYKESLNYYFSYINNIPKKIMVYIISSNELIWEDIEQFIQSRPNTFLLKKENRGRDISALLVAFKPIALQKKYICFIHDKKELFDDLKEDTIDWIDTLWSNTFKSEIYINNVLNFLQKEKIGILAPPKPFGNKITSSYTNTWDANFEIAKSLAEKMKLNCDMDVKKPPVILSTVFWCKTKALKKLLEINWTYEDFPEEPLPVDGTISHAIERIISYVAQDAGYTTEIIMNMDYSEKLLLKIHKTLYETYDLLKELFNIEDINDLKRFKNCRADMDKIFKIHQKVYLYGAGRIGMKLARWLKLWGYHVTGFLVTKKSEEKYIDDIPVYELQDIDNDDSMSIIVSVSKKYVKEIECILLKNNFKNYYIVEK